MKHLIIVGFLFVNSFPAFAGYALNEFDIKQLEAAVQGDSARFTLCPGELAAVRVQLKAEAVIDYDGVLQAEGQVYVRCKDSVEWLDSEYCQFRRNNRAVWDIHYCDH